MQRDLGQGRTGWICLTVGIFIGSLIQANFLLAQEQPDSQQPVQVHRFNRLLGDGNEVFGEGRVYNNDQADAGKYWIGVELPRSTTGAKGATGTRGRYGLGRRASCRRRARRQSRTEASRRYYFHRRRQTEASFGSHQSR